MSEQRTHRVIAKSEQHKTRPRNAAVPPHFRLIWPAYPYDWSQFSSITIVWFVRQTNGQPSSWSIKPRLQEGITSTRGYQDTNDFWQDLSREECEALCRNGKWLPDLDQTSGIRNFVSGQSDNGQPAPKLFTATIDNPPANLRINWGESGPDAFTMTGGTNPELQDACVIYGKVA